MRILTKLVIITLLLCATAARAAGQSDNMPSPVKDTTPYMAEDETRVIAFFKFSCPVCRNYHTGLEHWGKSLPKQFSFQFVPILEGDSQHAISDESVRASTIDHISDEAIDSSATTVVPADSIIVATRMSLGKVVRPRFDTAINQDLKALFFADGIDKTFAEHWWRSRANHIQSLGTGTTVKGIRLEDIRSLQIDLPPTNEQKRIADKLDAVLARVAMLNDLAIPKVTRERFKRDTKARRFASKLTEPQDEDKVFRFEQVSFRANAGKSVVDYVSLSDGEHQLAQLLGTFCMVAFPNVLFLLDEPESHFNPQWRVKFMSRLLDLPTAFGVRRDKSLSAQQDCLLTTHAPFVPSDMPRDKVFIFGKNGETGRIDVRQPDVETFGTTFDAILSECFDVHPPISDEPRKEIKELMASKDVATIKAGMERLGNSVDKVLLGDRVRQLLKEEEK